MSPLQEFFHRRKGRFSYLLALMLVQLLLSPWAETSGTPGRVTAFLGGGAVLAALYAISENRKVWMAGVILAVPAFVHRIAVWPDLRSAFSLSGLGASIVFDIFVTAFILQEILRHDDITSQTIYGALCAYLTAGNAFGHLYMLLVRVNPASFVLDARLFHHAVAAQPDLIYYSYVTLIALGANGIAPAGPYTRCFSMIEGILGVIYLTVLLGRLVGLHVSQRIMKASADGREE
jgi:voltage-gated potassium channel